MNIEFYPLKYSRTAPFSLSLTRGEGVREVTPPVPLVSVVWSSCGKMAKKLTPWAQLLAKLLYMCIAHVKMSCREVNVDDL